MQAALEVFRERAVATDDFGGSVVEYLRPAHLRSLLAIDDGGSRVDRMRTEARLLYHGMSAVRRCDLLPRRARCPNAVGGRCLSVV